LVKDINRFTKAGSALCMKQHRDLIARLAQAGQVIDELGLNQLDLSPREGGLGIVAAGAAAAYVDEGMEIAGKYGFERASASLLRIAAVHPYPARAAQALLEHCGTILVLEELEPHIERSVFVQAQQLGYRGKIVGKLDDTFERIGEYGVQHVVRGIAAALDLALPNDLLQGTADAERSAAARPITVCAGCPHRGTFIAIDQAIRKSGLKRDAVMVTGDIGCTILGMNPPFDEMWTELSMGASIGLAMGFAHAGVQTPVIATIGDSTFFHAGLPALVDAVQNQVPLTLVILDNGWTSMTGMQVNAGTDADYQAAGNRALNIARVVPGLGVDQFFEIDPFDLDASTATIRKAIQLPGVKVVLARQECVMPVLRRGTKPGLVRVIAENCNLCKLCIIDTGCPAISLGEEAIVIDSEQCYGCNLCGAVCNRNAIETVPAARPAQAAS
jgi:indolepyruvate ferredoxin oxidoreductase alpha subunit